jgi:hypothetical protein
MNMILYAVDKVKMITFFQSDFPHFRKKYNPNIFQQESFPVFCGPDHVNPKSSESLEH